MTRKGLTIILLMVLNVIMFGKLCSVVYILIEGRPMFFTKLRQRRTHEVSCSSAFRSFRFKVVALQVISLKSMAISCKS